MAARVGINSPAGDPNRYARNASLTGVAHPIRIGIEKDIARYASATQVAPFAHSDLAHVGFPEDSSVGKLDPVRARGRCEPIATAEARARQSGAEPQVQHQPVRTDPPQAQVDPYS